MWQRNLGVKYTTYILRSGVKCSNIFYSSKGNEGINQMQHRNTLMWDVDLIIDLGKCTSSSEFEKYTFSEFIEIILIPSNLEVFVLSICYPVLWVSTFDSLTVIGTRGLRCAKVSFKEASSSRKRIRDRIRALLVLRTRKRFKTREGDSCSRRDSMKQNYISIAIGVTECGLGRYRLDTDY